MWVGGISIGLQGKDLERKPEGRKASWVQRKQGKASRRGMDGWVQRLEGGQPTLTCFTVWAESFLAHLFLAFAPRSLASDQEPFILK